jgi:Asp-tRNA(Asn)/Glu-tRNA(Gln) amidotransferase C subunit
MNIEKLLKKAHITEADETKKAQLKRDIEAVVRLVASLPDIDDIEPDCQGLPNSYFCRLAKDEEDRKATKKDILGDSDFFEYGK